MLFKRELNLHILKIIELRVSSSDVERQTKKSGACNYPQIAL